MKTQIRFKLGHISVQDLIVLVNEVESEGAYVEVGCEYQVVVNLLVDAHDPSLMSAVREHIKGYCGEVEEEEVG